MKPKLTNNIRRITKRWKLGDFFRNFIAVVLGIIITFTGSDMIAKYNTNKDIKQSLELIKSELIINREEVKGALERVELEQNGARYLMQFKGRMEQASKDSLTKYAYLPFQWTSLSFVTDALEMLKSSALIQKIENRELSLQIIKAYNAVRSAEQSFENFSSIKKNLQDNLITNTEIQRFMVENHNVVDIWNFYLSHPQGVSLVQQIPQIQSPDNYYNALAIIDKTIAALNNND